MITGNIEEIHKENKNQQKEDNLFNLQDEEALTLHNSYHLGMVLVTVPLTSKNFLSWSRSIRIALGAKTKIGFIDGTCPPLSSDSPQFGVWKRVDCMVMSWILNSISKEISKSFIYADFVQDLWLEIEVRFGESNGPLISSYNERLILPFKVIPL